MGGYQDPGRGPGDDGFDEEGYDESQRAEILETTSDGPSDGNLLTDLESIWSFTILQALMMGCVGLSTSNFSAMAMEKMGEIAGTASSLQGFVTTLGGAVIGAQIGQSFDGTTVPLYAGFLAMGVLAFVAIAIAEKGRLFRPS